MSYRPNTFLMPGKTACRLRREAEARLRPASRCWHGWSPTSIRKLNFARGLVVLTDRRVLGLSFAGLAGTRRPGSGAAIGRWGRRRSCAPGTKAARARWSCSTTMAGWPTGDFTASRAAAAHRLVERFKAFREGEPAGRGGGRRRAESLCQACGTAHSAGQHLCSACAAAAATRPAQSLFRLVPFARARAGMIALGVWPEPGEHGGRPGPDVPADADHRQRVWFLTSQTGRTFPPAALVSVGMAGASILTWLLAWARNYVLAWVSERIAADLRNATYTHLQRLSLEFFGGKRTGDLISRVSSDTEHINIFLPSICSTLPTTC